jgi:ATP-dependent helicase/nuclease subunit B
VKRTAYLRPSKKLADEVADWLCGGNGYEGRVKTTPSGAKSLAHVLVVVPTAQSSRRLRLALAKRASIAGWGGLLPPCVSMSSALLNGCGGNVASEAAEIAVLAEVLEKADLDNLPALFPRIPEERGMRWALDTAESLLGISHVLGEGAIFAREVECGAESERWRDIAKLEGLFFEALKAKGLVSRLASRRAAADAGCRMEGISEIVLPGLVDAQPALVKYLENSKQDVTVLVHADRSEAALFDGWGRPIGYFAAPVLPDDIHPAPTAVVEADDIAVFFRSVNLSDALPALAVCDQEMYPELEGAFQNKFRESELVLRNPSRESVARSALGRLLLAILSLSENGEYKTFSAFLRTGDVARWLARELEVPPAKIASFTGALDQVQNAHLPRTVDETLAAVRSGIDAARRDAEREALCGLLKMCELVKGELGDAFGFLRKIFAGVTLDERNPGDRELVAAAEQVRALKREVETEAVPVRSRAMLFSKLLKRAAFMLEPLAPNILSANGWLEVPWCDEDELVIAGFNEECVPESIVGHPFIPDSLRASLGLLSNEMRAMRDSFIFAEALRCRAEGRVRVHMHQIAGDKNVMKPSRILFGGISDGDLPELARRLYAVTKGNEGSPPKELPAAWRLRLPFPPDGRVERKTMSPTRLDQYLRCPFTFFMQETFGSPSDDDAQELDAMTFGTFCHTVLDRFAKNGPKDSADEKEIGDWLEQEARILLGAYGAGLPAIIELQGESTIARLRNFAPVQAARRRAGWRIVAAEQSLECRIKSSNTLLRGKVDRIDENEHTGELAIIDYKTWEAPREDVASLQLPVYRAMVQCSSVYSARAAEAKAMYCILAKRAEDTLFDEAHAFGSAGQSEAEDTVVELLERIAHGIFYPPSKDGDWERDFGGMIWESPEEGIDPAWIEDQKIRALRLDV